MPREVDTGHLLRARPLLRTLIDATWIIGRWEHENNIDQDRIRNLSKVVHDRLLISAHFILLFVSDLWYSSCLEPPVVS